MRKFLRDLLQALQRRPKPPREPQTGCTYCTSWGNEPHDFECPRKGVPRW